MKQHLGYDHSFNELLWCLAENSVREIERVGETERARDRCRRIEFVIPSLNESRMLLRQMPRSVYSVHIVIDHSVSAYEI